MIVISNQPESDRPIVPEWIGHCHRQEAQVGNIKLVVRKNVDNPRFSVFVNGKRVSSDAVDLHYARRQALYEVEAMVAAIQVDLNLLWNNTP